MMKLFSMASHGYPSRLGAVFLPEQGYGSLSKDFHHVQPYHSNQDFVKSHSFNLSHQQKEEWKPAGGLLNNDQFVRIDRACKRPSLVDIQGAHPDSILLSFGITERLTRQEKILKLLASGSIELESGSVDLSMLYDLMGPQQLVVDFPHQSLIYPNTEFCFNEPLLNFMRDRTCSTENSFKGTEMRDVLSVMSRLYLSKNAVKSNKQTILVPYFEWRKRARINTDALKLATDKDVSTKSSGKTKEKTSHKKKTSTRAGQEREIYGNSYLHAFESFLSIIIDRKHQGKNAILSLKKSGSQLPQLLFQFSASIAGTGIALVLSIFCRVACYRAPLCGSKVLSTGLGLGLVWLSWAINKLRNTVISISKTSGKEKEDEMMNNLDGNSKDIYFRAAALMAIAVLKLG